MKRTMRGRTSKKKDKTIRCNRPNWRKKNKRFVGAVKYQHKGKKVKGKEWEEVKV